VSNTIEDVRRILSSRLTQLDEERERIEAALRNLGQSSSGDAPSGTPPRPRRKRRKRAKRGERRQQVLDALGAGEKKGAELARAIGVSPNQVYVLARQLQKEGLISKRAGRYSLKSKSPSGSNATAGSSKPAKSKSRSGSTGKRATASRKSGATAAPSKRRRKRK
jgi:hypothetical protein